MKFSLSLNYNIVPEWSEFYINYNNLKKTIYDLHTNGDDRSEDEKIDSTLVLPESFSTYVDVNRLDVNTKIFISQMNAELAKIEEFYDEKYRDFTQQYLNLMSEYDSFQSDSGENSIEKVATRQTEHDIESDDEEDISIHDTSLLHHSEFNLNNRRSLIIKKKIKILFIELSELKSYIELNFIGFNKICKKFDKMLSNNLKTWYIPYVQSFAVFSTSINYLDFKLHELIKAHSILSNCLLEDSKAELKLYLREQIILERQSLWKDLLPHENFKIKIALAENTDGHFLELPLKRFHVFGGSFVVPKFITGWRFYKICLAILVAGLLLGIKTLNDRVQGRCLALLCCVAILWATEALPLFTTSMLVPFLVVLFKVLKNSDGTTMGGADAAAYILSEMWNSIIMLLLGGFTLATALSKHNIAKIASSYMLYAAGERPRLILLVVMSLSLFLSMWISNVATPVIIYSLIESILRTIPTESGFAKALILGVALASNVGGMASPISSPQNIVAIGYMNPNPGWGNWFAVALPVAILCVLAIWCELIFFLKGIRTTPFKVPKPIKAKFNYQQYIVVITAIVTILLWCVLTKMEDVFGASGIISIIPIVIFFGTGILTVDDINQFPWSIVLLAMGGLALGASITSSGLLATIAQALQRKIFTWPILAILAIFGLLILVVATFVSHTVAALVIVPLVKEIGDSLPSNHSSLLIMGTALLASAAMGLPTSGFPNVTAISQVDKMGKNYLTVNTFIMFGVPASIICYVIVILVGYGVMSALNF